MPDQPTTKPEPQSFADLAMQPTGSGVADEETAFLEAALEDAAASADTIGESVPRVAAVPTEGRSAEDESGSHPS